MKETVLDRIIDTTRAKVADQRRNTDIRGIRTSALGERRSAVSHRFRAAFQDRTDTRIIAEIKTSSPSKGSIVEDLDVIKVAEDYERGGAAAISVITEEAFFGGSLSRLSDIMRVIDLPLLRKDFFIDEFQLYESAIAGADAILLIVAALKETVLTRLLYEAEVELGMDAIVEVHTIDELNAAKRAGARIIGVNNRDLSTFETSLNVSRELIIHRPPGVLMIAESGISSRQQIEELESLGYDGFLIGESLMRSGDAANVLKRLRGNEDD